MNNKILYSLSLCMALSLQAMEQKTTDVETIVKHYRSYNNELITPESLPVLAKASPEIEKAVTQWIENNKELVKQLTQFRMNIPEEVQKSISNHSHFGKQLMQEWEQDKKLLEQNNIPNLSDHSYSIPLTLDLPTGEKTTIVLKIPGKIIRFQNLVKHNQGKEWTIYQEGKQPCAGFTDEEKKNFTVTNTYQGISRAAHALKIQEAQKQKNLDAIKVPNTAIVAINTDNTSAHDESYVVIEEYIPNMQPVITLDAQNNEHISEQFKQLPPKVIQQACEAIKAGGAWNFKKNALLDKNNNLVFVDNEQPDRMPPHYFFNQNPLKIAVNATLGLHQLYTICQANKKEIIREFIKNDKELPVLAPNWFPEYKKNFDIKD